MDILGIVALAWSPSGRHIAYFSLPRGITIWDVENNKKIISHSNLGKWIKSVYWHPGSAYIYVFSSSGYHSGKNKSGEIQRWQFFDNTIQKKLTNIITKRGSGIIKINISTAQALELIAAWNAKKKNKIFKFEHITDPVYLNLLKQQCK